MTVENIITIISVIAAISGIIFGAAAFARNKRDEIARTAHTAAISGT